MIIGQELVVSNKKNIYLYSIHEDISSHFCITSSIHGQFTLFTPQTGSYDKEQYQTSLLFPLRCKCDLYPFGAMELLLGYYQSVHEDPLLNVTEYGVLMLFLSASVIITDLYSRITPTASLYAVATLPIMKIINNLVCRASDFDFSKIAKCNLIDAMH